MDGTDDLELGRRACERREWGEARERLAAAGERGSLGGSDLELLATAAYMLGRQGDYLAALERAHHAHIETGAEARAARAAFWLGTQLVLSGEVGPASGWLARAERLVERPDDHEAEAMNYRLAYAVGFHPWESLVQHRPFANSLLELVAREEDGREPPFGPALDLGCGSAVWSVELARRGWAVTGVELIEKALRRARGRVRQAEADVRLVQGDVTDLGRSEVGSGFRLLLDTGTFHGLDDRQREAMGRSVTEVAAPEAVLILDCFAPRRRGPLPRGADRRRSSAAFPDGP